MRAVLNLLLVVAVSMSTVGCASLWNPRVSYPGAFEERENQEPTCAVSDWNTINGSLKCATVARRDLDRRARDQAMLPRVIGSVLIPLSAAIAGLAITGTTGVPITALTLAGVATMGEGILLSNPRRREAYSIGASAVQCVITNTRPLAFRDDDQKFLKFQDNVRKLPGAIHDVNLAISALRQELASTSPPPDATTVQQIDEEIANAGTALATAKDLRTKAEDVIRRMNGAAEDIHASVDRIISLVNEEVDKLEPTMEGVRQALADQNQLRTSAFASLDALVKESEKQRDAAEARQKARAAARGAARIAEVTPLEAKRLALLEAVKTLVTAMAAVSGVVDRLGEAKAPQTCLTKVEGALGAGVLTVTLSNEEPVSPGQTVVFLVSGGFGDVSITTDTAGQTALDITHKIVGGVRHVVVKVKSNAKLGTYLIDVADKVANRIVKIVVVAPPPGPLKLSGSTSLKVETGTPVSFAVTGGNGAAPCSAAFDPERGFVKPETAVDDAKCTISTGWALPPPAAKQTYTLKVTFGGSTEAFTIEVTKK